MVSPAGPAGRGAAAVRDAKRRLRAEVRARRAARLALGSPATEAVAAGLLASANAAGLLDGLARDAPVGPPRALAAYLAAPGEPDTALLRAACQQQGGQVLLPIPGPDRVLGWALDDGRWVMAQRFPVPQPAGPEVGTGGAALLEHGVGLVLVPALAVDRSGARLGQGGGYYDRLLAELAGAPAAPAVVVVVHDDEVLPAGTVPREAHDVRVA
ncbi:MAG TPA: 5-formyltetrahydrofolate cyclo-ligase, partial [Candidatus Nanopelagicales bacterium]